MSVCRKWCGQKSALFKFWMWRGCPPPGACRPKRLPSASGGGRQQPLASAKGTPLARTPSSPSQSHPRSDTSGYTWQQSQEKNKQRHQDLSQDWTVWSEQGKREDKTLMINGLHSYPFCVKSTFFSGRMERIWLSTWSGFVWLVKVTLYCACKKTQTLIRNAAFPLIFHWKIVQNGFKMPTTL